MQSGLESSGMLCFQIRSVTGKIFLKVISHLMGLLNREHSKERRGDDGRFLEGYPPKVCLMMEKS